MSALVEALGVDGMPICYWVSVGFLDDTGEAQVAYAVEGNSLSVRGLVETAYELVLGGLQSFEDTEEIE